jgi:hypothetical protein
LTIKAAYLERHGCIHILDINATIVKKDVEDTDSLWRALREDIHVLEDVPDRLKDW